LRKTSGLEVENGGVLKNGEMGLGNRGSEDPSPVMIDRKVVLVEEAHVSANQYQRLLQYR
jgi:hypothetical protein